MTRRGTTAIVSQLVAATALAVASPALGGTEQATASRAVCAGQGNGAAPAAVQEQAMLCLVNRARSSRGLAPLRALSSLSRAADRKSGDILSCDEFSHQACAHEFTYWMSRFGYHGCAEGENIAWGSGRLGTPSSIFRAWMHSQGHRENILGPYEDTGIGLRTGALEGYGGAHVWTQEFGSRSC